MFSSTRLSKLLLFLLLAAGSLSSLAIAQSSSQGHIIQKVVRVLSIFNYSTLNFGIAAPGASEKTIAPGTSENPENGSFLVRGEPLSQYRILLPPNGSVRMRVGASSSPQRNIAVNDFRSYPLNRGLLNRRGEQMIFIGATRAALRNDQASGFYRGSYTVTVVY